MTREKMCSPRQMFHLLQWQIPLIREHRGLSWDDLLDVAAARYEDAKRLRRQEAA